MSGWDNAWWDGAVLMLARGEEGNIDPAIDPEAGMYSIFLRNFVTKWVQAQSPIMCVSVRQHALCSHGLSLQQP